VARTQRGLADTLAELFQLIELPLALLAKVVFGHFRISLSRLLGCNRVLNLLRLRRRKVLAVPIQRDLLQDQQQGFT